MIKISVFLLFFVFLGVYSIPEKTPLIKLNDSTFKCSHSGNLIYCSIKKSIQAEEYFITFASGTNEYSIPCTLIAIWNKERKNIYSMEYYPNIKDIEWNIKSKTLTLFYNNDTTEVLDILKNIANGHLSDGFYQDSIKISYDSPSQFNDFIHHAQKLIINPYFWLLTGSYIMYKIYKRIYKKSKNEHSSQESADAYLITD